MTRPPAYKWAFAARFRRHAFGWRSQPAVQRVREAAAEIQKLANKGPALAAAGAVLFLEKVSPALEQVDSSSGAIGTAVNHAIETCAKIIAEAPVDDETRDRWLELRPAHADPGGTRLRGQGAPLRRRGGSGRPALDRRRLWLRDHGHGRARCLLEHPGCRQERRMGR
jgi:hypothetical protein